MPLSKPIRLVFFFLLLAIQLDAQATTTESNLPKPLLQYLEQLPDFNGTLLIAKNDQILYQLARGVAQLEYDIPITTTTTFNLASITKLFTAVAILQLYERGLVQLDVPVGKYLPNYPDRIVRDSVTIYQLLTHTAGLPPFYLPALETNPLQLTQLSDFLPFLTQQPLHHLPGTEYHYSGGNFLLLGLIIESVAGQTYDAYLQSQVFAPAGMRQSRSYAVDALVPNRASGYRIDSTGAFRRNDYLLTIGTSAAGYYATADDVLRFSQALQNGTLLRDTTFELMIRPKVKGYTTYLGFGIDVDQRYGQPIIGHSGGWYGVRTELMIFRSTDHTVIVLSNQNDDGASGASKIITDLRVLVGNLVDP